MRRVTLISVVVLVLSTVVFGASAASADAPESHPYVCTGGNIPSGDYSSMVIAGICYMPVGTIAIRGNLSVEPGELLDAATPGDPAAAPVLPATVLVGGNVSVGRGAVLVLGCSPAGGCHGVAYDRIGGNLTSVGALGTVVQAVSIGGSATVIRGGGGVAGGPLSGGCFAAPIPSPWSQDPSLSQGPNGSPQYTDFEDSSIGGDLTVIGVQTCWIGSLRDRVAGNVTFTDNVTSDPDGLEIVNNLVGGNMACLTNVPAVQFGDSGRAPNVVGESGIGECGFSVIQPNPMPRTSAHVSVSAHRLDAYVGAHTQTENVAQMSLGTTASGDKLAIALNNVVLTGGGLTGRATVMPGGPLGKSGEVVAATVDPGGSQSFIAFDTCRCTFQGQFGLVSIAAYGSATAGGLTTGTFLITSGGDGHGALANLVGWGTFTSAGEPPGALRLSEHLAIVAAT